MQKRPRGYSSKLRLEAIRRVKCGEKSLSETAHELGVSLATLSRWIRQAQPDHDLEIDRNEIERNPVRVPDLAKDFRVVLWLAIGIALFSFGANGILQIMVSGQPHPLLESGLAVVTLFGLYASMSPIVNLPMPSPRTFKAPKWALAPPAIALLIILAFYFLKNRNPHLQSVPVTTRRQTEKAQIKNRKAYVPGNGDNLISFF